MLKCYKSKIGVYAKIDKKYVYKHNELIPNTFVYIFMRGIYSAYMQTFTLR